MSAFLSKVNNLMQYILAVIILFITTITSLLVFRVIESPIIPNFLFCVIWFFIYYKILPLICITIYGLFIDVVYMNKIGFYGIIFFIIYIITQKIMPTQKDAYLVILIKFIINFLLYWWIIYYIEYYDISLSTKFVIIHIFLTISIFVPIHKFLFSLFKLPRSKRN